VKVVLRADVASVGKKGDMIDVADGFGRNYLVRRVSPSRRPGQRAAGGFDAPALATSVTQGPRRRGRDRHSSRSDDHHGEGEGRHRRAAVRVGHGRRRGRGRRGADGYRARPRKLRLDEPISPSAPIRCRCACTPMSSSRSPSTSSRSDDAGPPPIRRNAPRVGYDTEHVFGDCGQLEAPSTGIPTLFP